ncbi:hypothetical protein [Collimonas humicola]|uniref:hypothetical protein n=1 Tax=Collimonas humicola TaxID=2825886 RepID=UPI001B8BA0EB|nr:hypothetical protein [Collimonas humicola]
MLKAFLFIHQRCRLSAILIVLLGATQTAIAETPIIPVVPSSPENIVQVRGKESVVQELNMGPDATELWHKLQHLVANLDDIQDFSKLVKLFNLTITDPVDAVSAKKPGFQGRNDIKNYMMKQVGYGITPDFQDKNKRVVKFSVYLYLDNICISSSEVRRVYGKGVIGIPTGVSQYLYSDTTGLRFSEAYGKQTPQGRNAPLIFSYMSSGCLESVDFQQPVIE